DRPARDAPLLGQGLHAGRRLAAALEQPPHPHRGTAQELAGLRGTPHVALGLPGRTGVPARGRADGGLGPATGCGL
ncbi:MAG: hypothetical protein AVDCRST_MAG32-130, partial [uncultured Nocardioides sp.]